MEAKTFLMLAKWLLSLVGEGMKKEDPVLIADDNEYDAELIREYLRREGVSAMIASTLREAENLLHEHKFRYVLLDVRFPQGDGIEFYNKMQLRYPRLPVFLVTGDSAALGRLSPGRLRMHISKGTEHGSWEEGIRETILAANGMNGNVPYHGVVLVFLILFLLAALSGVFVGHYLIKH